MISDLCVSTGTGTGPPCCFSASGGAIFTNRTASSGAVPYSIWEAYAGNIFPGTHTFNAGNSCQYVFSAFFNGFLGIQQNQTFTFNGSFSCGYFACCSSLGSLEVPVPGYPGFVNRSYVSGHSYYAAFNGVIITQGLGTSYFPGDGTGFLGYGGQYD
jgi:hypothetical protein